MTSDHGSARRRVLGITLIELMIVVAIVAILAAIGFPAYQNYARQAKRADAHEALQRAAQLQERYFGDANAYAGTLSLLGYALNGDGLAESPQQFWGMSVAVTPTTYTLTASPLAGQHVDNDCATITLNSAGVRGSAPGNDCW